ncbi:hypothetical protein [Paenibacillus ginsengihumi]|uniref:hypothetical protein n=1 Tax=Paenibacillus ginsengihumi TaxID=431596 RepID=UPI0012EBA255|nr:hypothetical protein [Paenibacillus ginsengihumi]
MGKEWGADCYGVSQWAAVPLWLQLFWEMDTLNLQMNCCNSAHWIPPNFQESQQMLYFVQQKRGDKPHMPLIVAKSATFRAVFRDLKPNSPKMLHELQQSPASSAKDTRNVVFFAGFAPHVTGVSGEGQR